MEFVLVLYRVYDGFIELIVLYVEAVVASDVGVPTGTLVVTTHHCTCDSAQVSCSAALLN